MNFYKKKKTCKHIRKKRVHKYSIIKMNMAHEINVAIM